MLSQITGKKTLCLLIGVSVLFVGSTFAQVMGGGSDDEINSWVLDWGTSTPDTSASNPDFLEWNLGWEAPTPPAPTPSPTPVTPPSNGGTSGSKQGGRLGTANYALKDRSQLATLARQMITTGEVPTHTAAPKYAPLPLEVVSSFLLTEAGDNTLITPYKEKTRIVAKKQPRVIAPTDRVSNSKYRRLSRGTAVLVKGDLFPVEKTHLMSWEGMNDDIRDYKYNVIKKTILNILVITGKVLFYIGIIGILLALLFHKKFHLYRRRKVQQLTLFSLPK